MKRVLIWCVCVYFLLYIVMRASSTIYPVLFNVRHDSVQSVEWSATEEWLTALFFPICAIEGAGIRVCISFGWFNERSFLSVRE